MKKTIIAIIIAILIIGGFAFYKYRYEPISFVESFLTDLEKEGADFELRDYLFSDLEAKPIVPWEEYYSKQDKSLQKEQYFKIWKDVYLSSVKDYYEIFTNYPNLTVMTYEDFKDLYGKFDFTNFDLKNSEISFGEIEGFGYVDLGYKASMFGISQSYGNKKFTVRAKNGSNGWKVLFFLININ